MVKPRTIQKTSRPDFADVSAARRNNMAAIKAKNTKPELVVRKLLHSLGYRYRLHRRDLPGRPDIVFPGRRRVIFVHGCFWHHHPDPGCKNAVMPKTRPDFWTDKLQANVARDTAAIAALEASGWETMVIWECEIDNPQGIRDRLKMYLGPPTPTSQ